MGVGGHGFRPTVALPDRVDAAAVEHVGVRLVVLVELGDELVAVLPALQELLAFGPGRVEPLLLDIGRGGRGLGQSRRGGTGGQRGEITGAVDAAARVGPYVERVAAGQGQRRQAVRGPRPAPAELLHGGLAGLALGGDAEVTEPQAQGAGGCERMPLRQWDGAGERVAGAVGQEQHTRSGVGHDRWSFVRAEAPSRRDGRAGWRQTMWTSAFTSSCPSKSSMPRGVARPVTWVPPAWKV